MQPPATGDMQEEMVAALDGAQGIREDWLLSYSLEARKYQLQVIGLQDFINRTWEAKPYGFTK